MMNLSNLLNKSYEQKATREKKEKALHLKLESNSQKYANIKGYM